MRQPAAVGHVDADCFYVSAERVRYPFLKGKAVGVLGNQGACVIAKSYEMKAAGVKTGEPIWDAVKKCPDGLYVKRDFRWYEVLSKKMLQVVRRASPLVEYYSIDEFFFEAPSGDDAQACGEALRDAILKEVGVPATVGIARTRTLAKLASDTAKPFGALALRGREEEHGLLARTPVTEISGIAKRRAATLAPYGIKTCLDFANAGRRLVRQLVTIDGEALWHELNGEPVRPIKAEKPAHKTMSRGGSLGGATDSPARIHAFLVRNLERLIEELEHHGVAAGSLNVCLMHRDGTEGGSSEALLPPTARFGQLLPAAKRCFARAWVPGLAASRMHVTASKLKKPGFIQRGLFEQADDGRAEALAALKREVNAEAGRFALRSGATLPLKDVYRDKEQGYDICDVRGKTCF